MKSLINKLFVFAIASVTLICVAAFSAHAQFTSQLEEKTIPVGEFTGIDVSDNFEVTITRGSCGARVTADKLLAPYVQVYVRGRILYITYDEKAVPKDVKVLYKGRNAAKPVFRAKVSLDDLTSLDLRENATLSGTDLFGTRLSTDINVTDKAQIKNINVSSGSVSLNIKKNAQVTATLKADSKVECRSEGNSNLQATIEAHDIILNTMGAADLAITSTGTNATLTTAGNSNTSVSFKGTKAVVNMSGTSDLVLSGKADELTLYGEKSAELEAGGLEATTATVNLNGSVKANVTVQDSLDANLSGGSTLYYSGNPTFKIGRIVKSTLAPYGTSSR